MRKIFSQAILLTLVFLAGVLCFENRLRAAEPETGRLAKMLEPGEVAGLSEAGARGRVLQALAELERLRREGRDAQFLLRTALREAGNTPGRAWATEAQLLENLKDAQSFGVLDGENLERMRRGEEPLAGTTGLWRGKEIYLQRILSEGEFPEHQNALFNFGLRAGGRRACWVADATDPDTGDRDELEARLRRMGPLDADFVKEMERRENFMVMQVEMGEGFNLVPLGGSDVQITLVSDDVGAVTFSRTDFTRPVERTAQNRVRFLTQADGAQIAYRVRELDNVYRTERLQVEKKDGRRVEGQLGRAYLLLTDDTGLKVYFSDRVVGGKEREILLER